MRNKNKLMLALFLCVLAALANSVMDAIQFRNLGDGLSFWDKDTSWMNKYADYLKGDTRPAFPFAKTALVFLTDGWHLAQEVMLSSFQLAIAILAEDRVKRIILYFIALKIVWGLMFTFMFDYIFTIN